LNPVKQIQEWTRPEKKKTTDQPPEGQGQGSRIDNLTSNRVDCVQSLKTVLFQEGKMVGKKKTVAAKKKVTAKKVASGKKPAAKKAAGYTKGYECKLCGYRLVVDRDCDCGEEHVILCCGQPMKKVRIAG